MTLAAPSRRGFIRGIGALLAAPAIVRAASLMPVRALPFLGPHFYVNRTIRVWLDVAAIRDSNVLLRISDYAGAPVR